MNEIYNEAIKKPNPIFLVNIRLYKTTRHGNSLKVTRTYAAAKKLVVCGTVEQIKTSKRAMLQCLTQISGKKAAFAADLTKYVIEEVEIISFHGYSVAPNENK